MAELTESVHVRLKPSEKAAVRKMADATNRSDSNWIRGLILAKFAEQKQRLERELSESNREKQHDR
ncbi:MAG: hypothetical protein OXH38_12185 [Chloroflexi bacterium]|nr:hypothetical protein [Chloroflexota bacterium]MYB21456.1 hypothetical protein [Chloroflexota bacterium]MYI04535.1 hypothetical protein [Chloroflexota bacterium]